MKFSKTLKLAKAKADKYYSQFIRLRDKDKPCITCGQYKSDKDCGHFISRRLEATRFDEENSHGQCLKCNRFEHGRQFEHGVAIDKLYGKGKAEQLLTKSRMLCKRDKYDYEYIAQYFKEKIEEVNQ